jgi:hypothetical protein
LRLARHHKTTGAVPHFDEADQFGPLNGLADCLPVGVEEFGRLPLGRQAAAGRKAAASNEF